MLGDEDGAVDADRKGLDCGRARRGRAAVARSSTTAVDLRRPAHRR